MFNMIYVVCLCSHSSCPDWRNGCRLSGEELMHHEVWLGLRHHAHVTAQTGTNPAAMDGLRIMMK